MNIVMDEIFAWALYYSIRCANTCQICTEKKYQPSSRRIAIYARCEDWGEYTLCLSNRVRARNAWLIIIRINFMDFISSSQSFRESSSFFPLLTFFWLRYSADCIRLGWYVCVSAYMKHLLYISVIDLKATQMIKKKCEYNFRIEHYLNVLLLPTYI